MAVFQEFLKTLPNVRFGFTYGSSYLIAPTGFDQTAQIDLILSVDDTFAWHKENLKANPKHYSGRVRMLGSDYLVKSTFDGAGIHFNPYVQHGNLMFKYGVIHHEHLMDDLKEWNTFYCAGRMQKPVQIVKDCEEMQPLMKTNYKMALIVGSLISSSLVHETDLYTNICKLSYFGDKRLEDPLKIHNLVFGNLPKFQEIYRPLVLETQGLTFDNEFIERKSGFYENLKNLPGFLSSIQDLENMNVGERYNFIMEIFKKNNSKFSGLQIWHTLKTGSFSQIFKYSLSKFKKSLKSNDNQSKLLNQSQ